MPDPVQKDSRYVAGLLRNLAELIDSYGAIPWGLAGPRLPYERLPVPQQPFSQSVLGPLDMATIYPAKIAKVDEEQQLVFGWASVSTRSDGRLVVDTDDEMIEPGELEKAAYDYVLEFRDSGEMHKGEANGRMVESFVLTPEKSQQMGLPTGNLTGWWVGYKLDDAETFAKVKDGTYSMFSIAGSAERVEV